MSDAEDTTQSNPGSSDRESETGRYVSRQQDADGDGVKDDEEKEGKKRWLLLLILLLILLLLLCAGYSYWRWWRTDDPETTPTPTAVSTTATAQPSPTATATSSPSASPSPEPAKTVAMPDVVGMKADAAKATLEAAGLTNLTFLEEGKTDPVTLLVDFSVTAQSVAAGTQVPLDQAITLTVKSTTGGLG